MLSMGGGVNAKNVPYKVLNHIKIFCTLHEKHRLVHISAVYTRSESESVKILSAVGQGTLPLSTHLQFRERQNSTLPGRNNSRRYFFGKKTSKTCERIAKTTEDLFPIAMKR